MSVECVSLININVAWNESSRAAFDGAFVKLVRSDTQVGGSILTQSMFTKTGNVFWPEMLSRN